MNNFSMMTIIYIKTKRMGGGAVDAASTLYLT